VLRASLPSEMMNIKSPFFQKLWHAAPEIVKAKYFDEIGFIYPILHII
jgi:hypothetical protein